MNTWLEDFHAKTNLNKYPVSLRTRSGVGYRLPSGETVSKFAGHPVHYLEGGLWKPITLQPHSNGDFEGSDFSWRGGQILYKNKRLLEPKAVILNGVRHPLSLRQDENRIVADLPFGQYEIVFREGGVRETLTIPQPVEGLLEFDIPHAKKPEGLIKQDRHIVGGITAESFYLTKDMSYPLVIDPDYAGTANDYVVNGASANRTVARSTSSSSSTPSTANILSDVYGGPTYQYGRYFVRFDTSGIPDTDSVSNATMTLTPTNTYNDTNILIRKHDWSGVYPIGSGNRETAYDDCLAATTDVAWSDVTSLTINVAKTSPSLDATRINLTGNTYYSVLTSMDSDNTNFIENTYGCSIAAITHATSGYRPFLTVTHAAGGNGSFHYLT